MFASTVIALPMTPLRILSIIDDVITALLAHAICASLYSMMCLRVRALHLYQACTFRSVIKNKLLCYHGLTLMVAQLVFVPFTISQRVLGVFSTAKIALLVGKTRRRVARPSRFIVRNPCLVALNVADLPLCLQYSDAYLLLQSLVSFKLKTGDSMQLFALSKLLLPQAIWPRISLCSHTYPRLDPVLPTTPAVRLLLRKRVPAVATWTVLQRFHFVT